MKSALLITAIAMIATTQAQAKEPTYKTGNGTAVVMAVDKAAGKIKLNHGPIAALKWPGMKMGFTAKPELLKNVAVGDKIAIGVRSGGGKYEIISIAKQ